MYLNLKQFPVIYYKVWQYLIRDDGPAFYYCSIEIRRSRGKKMGGVQIMFLSMEQKIYCPVE